MAKLNEREQKIVEFIENDKVMKNYIYDGYWISGSSTVVYPITVWSNDITIQLKWTARPNYFKGFFKRLKDEFGLKGFFEKLDGSCPNVITIFTNDI